MARFILKKSSGPAIALAIQKSGERTFHIDLDTSLKKNIPLGNSPLNKPKLPNKSNNYATL